MKKIILGLILGVLIVGMFSIVYANNPNGNGENNNSNNVAAQNQTGDNNASTNQGLGQTIRNRVHAGVYTSESGEQIRVSEMAQGLRLRVNNVSVDCDCNLTQEQVKNKTKLKVQLSNGKNSEVKIMPDVASERALARLRIRVCDESNNCTIRLKETGEGEQVMATYEMQIQRHFKILGLFKTKAQIRAQVDAENGEVTKINKPWWAFIASEPEE